VGLALFGLFVFFTGFNNMRYLRKNRRFKKNIFLMAFYVSSQITVIGKRPP
jgi:hypothetical protein